MADTNAFVAKINQLGNVLGLVQAQLEQVRQVYFELMEKAGPLVAELNAPKPEPVPVPAPASNPDASEGKKVE